MIYMSDFYKKDNKNYELKRNKEFLNWLKNQIKNGYSCALEIEEIINEEYIKKYSLSMKNIFLKK